MFDQFNLTKKQKEDWAVHLPALSAFYVHQLSKLDKNPDHYGVNRWNPDFEAGHKGLNWMSDNGYFKYKWGLYSAGHAKLDVEKSKESEPMLHERPKDHVIVGDSGGFQVAKGAGHFANMNWDDFKGVGGDKVRQSILDWLEETSDYAMTLDIPAFATQNPKTGLKTFEDTLDYSLINLEYFLKHRTPGKTKFLNVLSGTDFNDSKKWYDEVKKYSDKKYVKSVGYEEDRTLEGYAFAGVNMRNMPSLLARMSDLIEDDLIEDKEWIHFLGIGRLDWACYLTLIQRQLRKNWAPKVTLSFDCASAFLATAKGQMYTHPSFTNKRFGYNMKKAVDDRNLTESELDMPFGGPIAGRMKVKDMCRLKPGQPNKIGKIGKTSWDNGSYLLAMASNVYIHINAVQEANRIMDFEMTKYDIDYRNWTRQKRSSTANDVSTLIPSNVLFFSDFVEKFFDKDKSHSDRMQMIEDNRPFLSSISFGKKTTSNFGDLFDLSAIDNDEDSDDIDEISSYENMDDFPEED